MFVNCKALCISVMGDLIRSSPDNETSNVANSVCTLFLCFPSQNLPGSQQNVSVCVIPWIVRYFRRASGAIICNS